MFTEGPGKYHKDRQMIVPTHNKKLKSGGFQPNIKPVLNTKPKKDDAPGPGHYEIQNTVKFRFDPVKA